MDATELKYPILCFTKYGLSIFARPEHLTTAFAANLRSDYYKKLTIIDSSGKTYKVARVAKVGWIGPFWGFSLMYSRRVRITLEIVTAMKQLSLNEVRDFVANDFQKSPEWSSRVDFDKMKSQFEQAQTVEEIIRAVHS